MAYAALVSLSQTIDKFLHHQDQYPISLHLKQQIISIHRHIIFLQDFLENFPQKGNNLEGRIRDVVNQGEDIAEFFMWKQIDEKRNHTSKSTSGPESSEVSHRIGMGYDFENLNKITGEIESIVGEVIKIKSSARSTDDDSCVVASSSSSSSSSSSPSSSKLIIAPPASDHPIVGFEDDLLEIKGRLCGESSQLQVIPIFGMGGIGKTTLATNVYEDQLTAEHFQIRAWVTVSQDYSVSEILSSLVVSVGAEHYAESDEAEMAQKVYKSLKGRRYLIVLDDMWSTKAWDDMGRIFPNDHNGSRILLTTRLLDVAAYPSSSGPLHVMRFMDADQSWNLLRKKVFKQGNCPCELEDIGKTIAKSCRGLPLAIAVIAGLLSSVGHTQASWVNIAENVNKVVTTNDEQFAEIVLSLSYNHLPYHLRPCFLYMGIFPEDHEIRASRLIKLWVAEGFLKLPNGSKNFEEVAEEYLEHLVKRSLILVMKRKSNGKIKICNVHDLVRDLCMRKAQQEKFLLHVDREIPEESIRNQRRISIKNYCLNFRKVISGLSSRIHTVICFRQRPIRWSRISLREFILLRVFEIVSSKFGNDALRHSFTPPCNQIFELFHLRYLSIHVPTMIPATISVLENLQTLIFDPRKSLNAHKHGELCFPPEIWRMPQLRHLVSFAFCSLPNPPEEKPIFALENLQTLSVANFVCSERTVEMIPNLKKLVITYSPISCAPNSDYRLENLVHLHHLEKLKLQVRRSFPFRAKLNSVFPRTLKKLTLIGWPLSWEDIGTAVGSLPYLEVLKLKNVASKHGNTWETREGEFCLLKFLLIREKNLCHWVTESSHFPRLERLLLHRCWRLDEIPDSFGEIPTLELIEIDARNDSILDSAKRIQEEQRSWGNDALQVRLRG